MGVMRRRVGNAIANDTPQAANHVDAKLEVSSTPLKVPTKETRQLVMIESSNGVTSASYRAGSFGTPRTIAWSFERVMTTLKTCLQHMR